MYYSTFIFAKKQFDDEFHRLDEAIAAAVKEIPGYLGEESWENEQTGLHSEVYYGETLDALKTLVGLTEHRVAKAEHARWIGDYRVVIAQVQT